MSLKTTQEQIGQMLSVSKVVHESECQPGRSWHHMTWTTNRSLQCSITQSRQ